MVDAREAGAFGEDAETADSLAGPLAAPPLRLRHAGCRFAEDELQEQATVPALLIVLAGTGPAILMNEALRRLGEGRRGMK